MKASNDGIHTELDTARRRQVLETMIRSGVEIIDPDRTYVGEDVQVDPGVVVFPGTHLSGSTYVAAGFLNGPDCWIEYK